MPNRLPAIAGAATIGLIGLVALAWVSSQSAQPRLARRTAARLAPRRG